MLSSLLSRETMIALAIVTILYSMSRLMLWSGVAPGIPERTDPSVAYVGD